MNSRYYTHLPKFLLISGTWLGLFLILVFSFGGYANSNPEKLAKYAKVDSIVGGTPKYAPVGTNRILGFEGAEIRGAKGGERGDILQFPINELLVPIGPSKDIARLIFISNTSNTKLPKTYYVARSSQQTNTIFYYPCQTQGNFGIGWKGEEKSDSDCDAFALRKTTKSTNKQLSQKEKRKRPVVTFCSASAESGAWGATISDSSWDLLSPNDPCREAIRRCEVNSNQSPCTVTSFGEKYPKELGEQWTSVLVCNKDASLLNNPPRTQDIFSKLDGWVRQQASVNSPLYSSNCSLHVISADELLVIPAPKQTTVISAGDDIPYLPPSFDFNIVVLAGKVTLVFPDPKVPTYSLSAGQACLVAPVACETSSAIESGGRRQGIYNSPAVQSFLKGWETPGVQEDINQNYAPEIERQFLTAPQPVIP